jgi:hypothetical protein
MYSTSEEPVFRAWLELTLSRSANHCTKTSHTVSLEEPSEVHTDFWNTLEDNFCWSPQGTPEQGVYAMRRTAGNIHCSVFVHAYWLCAGDQDSIPGTYWNFSVFQYGVTNLCWNLFAGCKATRAWNWASELSSISQYVLVEFFTFAFCSLYRCPVYSSFSTICE